MVHFCFMTFQIFFADVIFRWRGWREWYFYQRSSEDFLWWNVRCGCGPPKLMRDSHRGHKVTEDKSRSQQVLNVFRQSPTISGILDDSGSFQSWSSEFHWKPNGNSSRATIYFGRFWEALPGGRRLEEFCKFLKPQPPMVKVFLVCDVDSMGNSSRLSCPFWATFNNLLVSGLQIEEFLNSNCSPPLGSCFGGLS